MIGQLMAVMVAAAPPVAEPEFETSAPLQTPEEAWQQPGFRVSIAYAFEGLIGLSNTPSGELHTAALKVGVRVDERWSLFSTLRYGARLGDDPLLRYGVTVEPTFHITDEVTLVLGVGVAGFVFPDTGAPTPEPRGGLIASYTLAEPEPLLGACDGVGVMALLRLEYSAVFTEYLSMGPALQIDGQYTGCTQNLNQTNPDTANEIALRQFWTHTGVSIAWLFHWR